MDIVEKIRRRETPFWDWLYRCAKRARGMTLPRMRPLGALLFNERRLRRQLLMMLKNQYCAQIMAYRCARLGRNIQWQGETPMVIGDGEIEIGDNCVIGNQQTWVVGLKVFDRARLVIGDHTTINYRTLISVAQEVRIGRHCMLAGEIKIFDNNSHPTDHLARRANQPLSAGDVAPVLIGDDVWIGAGAVIMKGVRIGEGAIVAAGAVVVDDVAPFTVVGGNPARVLKTLMPGRNQNRVQGGFR